MERWDTEMGWTEITHGMTPETSSHFPQTNHPNVEVLFLHQALASMAFRPVFWWGLPLSSVQVDALYHAFKQ